MKNKKLFVWDFHGTLEKGNDDALLEIVNFVLEKHGYGCRLTHAVAETLTGKKIQDYFAFLLPDKGSDACVQLQNECISVAQRDLSIIKKHIKANHHALEVLEAIHRSHHDQLILSNTQPHSLDIFLEAVNIDHFFPSTHRLAADHPQFQGRTKKDWLHHFLSAFPIEGEIVAIGDSPTDIDFFDCHPRIKGYLYAYPERKHRETHCCHFKIDDLRFVLNELT